MAERIKDKTGSQTIRKTINRFSVKPPKARIEEPGRREYRSNKEMIQNDQDHNNNQKQQSIVDILHLLSAQPSLGFTSMARFFSIESTPSNNFL